MSSMCVPASSHPRRASRVAVALTIALAWAPAFALAFAPVQRPKTQTPQTAGAGQPRIQRVPAGGGPEHDTAYRAALLQLRDASLSASDTVDPMTLEGLESAIETIEAHPAALARDPQGRHILAKARMNLARGYRQLGDASRVEAIIDEAIRQTHEGLQEAADSFGPLGAEVADHRARVEAEPRFPIEVSCEVECELSIDGYPKALGRHLLLAGSHRVHVRSLDARVESFDRVVVLGEQREAQHLKLAPPPPPPPPAPKLEEEYIPPSDYAGAPRFKPGLPAGMIVLGGVLTFVGVIWVGAGSCPRTADCGVHQPVGATLAAVGLSAAIVWIPLLVIDRSRRRVRAQRVISER